MQPNQQYNPVPNQDPNLTPPTAGQTPANDPWARPAQSPVQPGYPQPQVAIPPAQQPYDPWQIQVPQPGTFHQPGATPASPPQRWNPETSMFEPVQPVRPSEWEQQFVAETVAAAAAPAVPKKSHVGRVIAIIVSLVVLLGGGVAAFVYAQQKQAATNAAVATQLDTKALFYDAIENHMKVKYIHQQYDSEQDGGTSGTLAGHLDGITDFSDPAKPKSRVAYTIKNDDSETVVEMAGELLDLQEANYYAMVAKTATNAAMAATTTEKDIQADTWYKIPRDNSFTRTLIFDPIGALQTINVTTGQVLVGNYKDDMRRELLSFINDRKVYTINSSEAVTFEDKEMTKYDISVDADALKELNKKAETMLGVTASVDSEDDSLTQYDGTVKYEFLVDNNTKHIAKVKLERKSTKGSVDGTATVLLSYPKNITEDLKTPAVVKDIPLQD